MGPVARTCCILGYRIRRGTKICEEVVEVLNVAEGVGTRCVGDGVGDKVGDAVGNNVGNDVGLMGLPEVASAVGVTKSLGVTAGVVVADGVGVGVGVGVTVAVVTGTAEPMHPPLSKPPTSGNGWPEFNRVKLAPTSIRPLPRSLPNCGFLGLIDFAVPAMSEAISRVLSEGRKL